MAEGAAERRRYPRLSAAVDIQYRLQPSAAAYGNGSTANISAVGICLILYEEPKIGAILELNVNLPDGAPAIKTKGKVIWVKSFDVANENRTRFDAGIAFLDLSENDKNRISNYVFKFQ